MQVFLVDLKNKPGELARVAEAIAAKGVNIKLITGSTCGTSGRLLLATNDEAATQAALGDAGCSFESREMVETSVPDVPGTVAKAARRLADAGINIEALAPTGMQGGNVTVAFITDQPAKAKELLAHATASG